jgi:hypothetical protein
MSAPLVRMILVQFVISKQGYIPPVVFGMRKEKEFVSRDDSDANKPNVQNVLNCSLQRLDLASAGYSLVDANTRKVEGEKIHYTVSFWFCQNQFVKLSDEFQLAQAELTREFNQICQSAFWKMRLFTSQFFDCSEGGKVLVPNQLFALLNFNDRTAIKNPDGSSVLRWRRDANKEKIGDAPVPIWPSHFFKMDGGQIAVFANEEQLASK